jgi:hypothetical protein
LLAWAALYDFRRGHRPALYVKEVG